MSARAARALAHLGEADPGLGLLALWIAHEDGPGETRSEARRIVYGADFETRPLPEQVGLVAHHVLHVALRHPDRRGAFEARFGDRGDAFNLAADAIVNEIVLAAGHAVPRPALRLAPLLGAAQGAAPGEVDFTQWDVERLARALSDTDVAAARSRDHGVRRGFAPDIARGTSGGGEADDGADWQGRVSRAAEIGRNAGRGAGATLSRIADNAVARIPWQHRLRRLATPALGRAPRRRWRRPARSWIARAEAARQDGRAAPIFEPARSRDRHRPRIAVALDTSSSVSRADLAMFAAEAGAIAARTGAETHLLGFDDAVHHVSRLEPGRLGAALAMLAMRRGGGTDFAPVLAAAAALRPSVIVVLCDLDGPVGAAPGPPVIWAVPRPGAVAPFGTVIDLSA